jgi:transcriptional regulator with XRE-family HTH domain
MAHPVDIYVGKRLRMRRTIMGLSQEALGTATGITFQQIQKYERGINRVGSSRLYAFSRLLDVGVAYFFEGYEGEGSNLAAGAGLAEGGVPDFEHEQLASRETLEMMRSYYRIENPAVRKRVFDLVKAMADKPESVEA